MRADEHLTLHGLAVKRHATAEQVANLIGGDVDTVHRTLMANTQTGRVLDLNGKFALSPGAHMIVKGEYSRHYGALRSSQAFAAAYERFEAVNEDLKTLITAWQVRPLSAGQSVANDHSDPEYDEKVIDRLGTLHERFEPTLRDMATEVPRLAHYAKKLDEALERAERGEVRWVSEVTIDSYHTVWFELHEDLLCMLGKQRVE